jgi:hypothetical protein
VDENRVRVFDKSVLRKIFGLKRDKVRGQWRRMNNNEFYHLYSSQILIRVIKSRRMRLGHVTHMGRKEVYKGFCWEKVREVINWKN